MILAAAARRAFSTDSSASSRSRPRGAEIAGGAQLLKRFTVGIDSAVSDVDRVLGDNRNVPIDHAKDRATMVAVRRIQKEVLRSSDSGRSKHTECLLDSSSIASMIFGLRVKS